MVKRTLTLIVASLVIGACVGGSARRAVRCTATRSRKEQAVRKALADPQMTRRVLKAVREVGRQLRSGRAPLPVQRVQRRRAVAGRPAGARCVRALRSAAGPGCGGASAPPAGCRVSEQQAGEADSAQTAADAAHGASRGGRRASARRRKHRTRETQTARASQRPPARTAAPSRRSRTSARGAARCRAHHDRARQRSAVPRRADRRSRRALRRSAVDAPGALRCSIARCGSTAMRTSSVRSASAAIRTTRRASCSTRQACPATACIRSTARTVW